MSGGNLSGVYHFYTMAVTAATMVLIYIYMADGRCPTVRTKCKLLFLQTQAYLADFSTNVCHTCPLTYNDSYNPVRWSVNWNLF